MFAGRRPYGTEGPRDPPRERPGRPTGRLRQVGQGPANRSTGSLNRSRCRPDFRRRIAPRSPAGLQAGPCDVAIRQATAATGLRLPHRGGRMQIGIPAVDSSESLSETDHRGPQSTGTPSPRSMSGLRRTRGLRFSDSEWEEIRMAAEHDRGPSRSSPATGFWQSRAAMPRPAPPKALLLLRP